MFHLYFQVLILHKSMLQIIAEPQRAQYGLPASVKEYMKQCARRIYEAVCKEYMKQCARRIYEAVCKEYMKQCARRIYEAVCKEYMKCMDSVNSAIR